MNKTEMKKIILEAKKQRELVGKSFQHLLAYLLYTSLPPAWA